MTSGFPGTRSPPHGRHTNECRNHARRMSVRQAVRNSNDELASDTCKPLDPSHPYGGRDAFGDSDWSIRARPYPRRVWHCGPEPSRGLQRRMAPGRDRPHSHRPCRSPRRRCCRQPGALLLNGKAAAHLRLQHIITCHRVLKGTLNRLFIARNAVLIAGSEDGSAGWFDGAGHALREDGVHIPLPWTPSLLFLRR